MASPIGSYQKAKHISFIKKTKTQHKIKNLPPSTPKLLSLRHELEDTIGRDQLALALKRAESEQRDRKISEHSGSATPPKSGSRQNLERSLSQESPRKQANLRSRQNSVMPKDEKPEQDKVSKVVGNPK
jgi:hypothetical protein